MSSRRIAFSAVIGALLGLGMWAISDYAGWLLVWGDVSDPVLWWPAAFTLGGAVAGFAFAYWLLRAGAVGPRKIAGAACSILALIGIATPFILAFKGGSGWVSLRETALSWLPLPCALAVVGFIFATYDRSNRGAHSSTLPS